MISYSQSFFFCVFGLLPFHVPESDMIFFFFLKSREKKSPSVIGTKMMEGFFSLPNNKRKEKKLLDGLKKKVMAMVLENRSSNVHY
jgi:hypothetical protein